MRGGRLTFACSVAVAVAAILLPLVGCARGGPRNAIPDATVSSSDASRPEADAADAANATDAADEADAAKKSSCGPTVLQPHACISSHADLALDNDPIHAWFKARDTVIDDYVFEHCREVAFGPDAEHVLVCIRMGPRGMNGLDGPVEALYDLEVLAARNKRRVELLRVPFGFSMSSSTYDDFVDMFFSARYSLDAGAGTLDVEASREECKEAQAAIRTYWNQQAAEIRGNASFDPSSRARLLRFYDDERPAASERIASVCRAAGHYGRTRDGHLVR